MTPRVTDVPVADTPSFVVVLPAIAPDLAHACIASMSPILRARTLLVDNTPEGRIANVEARHVAGCVIAHRNLGVASSWNRGVTAVRARGAEYLIIVSQSITFGDKRGLDFLARLAERRPSMFLDAQYGWKLVAVATAAFDQVGLFDPVYDPAYYEESDFMYRAHLAGLCSPWYNDRPGRVQDVTIDAVSAGNGVAFHRGLAPGLDYGAQAARYEAKWGGPPRGERFVSPYGDGMLDWRYVGEYEERTRA